MSRLEDLNDSDAKAKHVRLLSGLLENNKHKSVPHGETSLIVVYKEKLDLCE